MPRLCRLIIAVILLPASLHADEPATGVVTGAVRDAQGNPVAGAVVMLCDDATGIPLTETRRVPFTQAVDEFQDDLSYRITNTDGTFYFDRIPEGTVKLIAQSWPDSTGAINDVFRVHGGRIVLRGIAKEVKVPQTKDPVVITPLGSCALEIQTDPIPGNDDTYVILSTGNTVADPILMFWSWGEEFQRNALGAAAMPKGKITVEGLPEGTIHAVAFASDSRPGFGEATTHAKTTGRTSMTIPIVAAWSNAHHDPPERLRPLVQDMASGKITPAELEAAMGTLPSDPPPKHYGDVLKALGGPAACIDLPGGAVATVADLLAAQGYVALLRELSAEASSPKPDQE